VPYPIPQIHCKRTPSCTPLILDAMMDIEGRPLVDNPYAASSSSAHPTSPILKKIVQNLQRLLYMAISLYGLHHFQAYQAILRSPHVSHEWFKAGLAATIGRQMLHVGRLLFARPQLTRNPTFLLVVNETSAFGDQGLCGNL
jgi:hypothetical protein